MLREELRAAAASSGAAAAATVLVVRAGAVKTAHVAERGIDVHAAVAARDEVEAEAVREAPRRARRVAAEQPTWWKPSTSNRSERWFSPR